jgi:GSCFA family
MIEDDLGTLTSQKDTTPPQQLLVEKIQARATPNPRWSSHFNNKLLTVGLKPLFGPRDVVFTIGSCFAERIRIAMTEVGVNVGPPMGEIVLNPDVFRIDALPQRPHMNYYNSFTIRQEFERHIGGWHQEKDDYWVLNKDPIWGGKTVYQDPYRRAIFARTPEDLALAVARCDEAIDRGIRQSDVFFMTLGMAEVFRNNFSGKIACQKPGYAGGAGADETTFHMSTYEENLENMSRVVEIIGKVRPHARIVVTVSPVGLARTFSDQDILTANTEGKSILRAALGALSRKYDNVTYFPSYEIVMSNSPFSFREDDGRHVNNWVVSKIVNAFKQAHYDENFGAISTAAE